MPQTPERSPQASQTDPQINPKSHKSMTLCKTGDMQSAAQASQIRASGLPIGASKSQERQSKFHLLFEACFTCPELPLSLPFGSHFAPKLSTSARIFSLLSDLFATCNRSPAGRPSGDHISQKSYPRDTSGHHTSQKHDTPDTIGEYKIPTRVCVLEPLSLQWRSTLGR